ncbi:MAG: DNA-binding NarL/FixJ family response regulator [Planctomycetota bacterium]|jgi:DNA-binding NarL/FixJ family response regulator
MTDASGIRALLLDDDEYALEYLDVILQERFPDLEVETRLRPDPSGSFDLYFIDDDFEGVRLAGKLARKIRAQDPNAMVLAFSASLDEGTLKELLNAGCLGVCDKKVPGDMPAMLDAIERAIDTLQAARREPQRDAAHLFSTLRSLFHEWNRRLRAQ